MVGIYLFTLATEILRIAMIFHCLLGYSFRIGKLKYILLASSFTGVYVLYFVPDISTLTLSVVLIASNFISTLYLFDEKIKKLFIVYIPVSLAAVTWDNLFIEIIKIFHYFDETVPVEALLRQLICNIMLILAIFLIWFVLKKYGLLYKTNKNHISRSVYFLCLSCIFMTTCIISIAYTLPNSKYQSNATITNLAFIVLAIIFQIVCIFLVFLFYSREQYKTLNRIREEYKEKQIDYYKALLAQEEDTRKFRHDIKNHILCIQELLDNDKIEDAQEYIKDIHYNLDKIVSIYDTGNDIINAIINYYATKGKTSNIVIQVKGQMRPDVTIPMMDLCTIVSNILSNAFEASAKVDENHEKMIQIEIRSGSKFFEFTVKNPTEVNRIKLDDKILTTKNDRRNHGFGIQNIKEIISKYDGEMHFIDETDRVTVKVIMKIT